MASREVKVAILGDARDFSRAIRQADNDAGKLGRSFSGLGHAAATAGKMAGLGLLAIGGAAALGAKQAIDAASDLNEVLSKSNTVFGEQGLAMEKWAETAAVSFGQSKKQALEAASSFGNMFVQLGMGQKDAAEMSRQMTELASDFVSFHNADITEVLEAQSAAFRGEYDSVQKFVPIINAAAVEQKALKLGLAKTTKELTQQDKALATQQLLLEGAGDAMGDFARTSGGLANKQRILAARLEDVKAKIGQGLLPVALALAGFFEDKLLPVFEEVGGGIRAFVIAFQHAENGVTSGGLAGAIEGLGIKARHLYDAVSKLVKDALRGLSAWWDKHGPTIIGYARGLGKVFTNTVLPALGEVAGFIAAEVIPRLADIAGWIIENEYLIKSFATLIGVALAGAFMAWAASAAAAAAATLLALAPFILVAAAAVALGAGLYYAYENWGWFRAGVDGVIGALQTMFELLLRISEVVDSIPGLPGLGINEYKQGSNSQIDQVNKSFKKDQKPKFANGGVMPGPRGVHSLAWVAGGETVLPTHKPGYGGGGGTYHFHNHGVIGSPAELDRWVQDSLARAGRRAT